MPVSTDENRIHELLTRGVEEVFVKEHLEQALKSGKQLRIKFGIDPTGPKIHLGRAVVLRKLKAFQELGHQIVLIIGDVTATIGDASDKTEKRPMLSREQVKENFKEYAAQIGKVLDMSRVELRYNSEWLKELGFAGAFELAEQFTVQQMLRRRNFSERFERGDEISIREFMYPLMQGYDSVAVRADVEIGGFDQLFNLQAGRVLQKVYGHAEQDIMTIQMLEGTDGRKMSTSWGNVITLVDGPNDMFGKIMSVRDDLLAKYFLLCTEVEEQEILEMELGMQNGDNPMQYKKRLGRELVSLYHGTDAAMTAEQEWEKTFSEGGIPEHVQKIVVTGEESLADVLLPHGIISSKSDFRRLVEGGAITRMLPTEEKVTDAAARAIPGTYKIGKMRFVELVQN